MGPSTGAPSQRDPDDATVVAVVVLAAVDDVVAAGLVVGTARATVVGPAAVLVGAGAVGAGAVGEPPTPWAASTVSDDPPAPAGWSSAVSSAPAAPAMTSAGKARRANDAGLLFGWSP